MKALRRYLPQIDLMEKRIPDDVLERMVVNNQDMQDAFREVTPTVMLAVYIESPSIHWSAVGGLERVKNMWEDELRERRNLNIRGSRPTKRATRGKAHSTRRSQGSAKSRASRPDTQ